jgi:hypothetical protein
MAVCGCLIFADYLADPFNSNHFAEDVRMQNDVFSASIRTLHKAFSLQKKMIAGVL